MTPSSPKSGPRALVVGAQGVLGAFVARALATSGWEVTRAGRRPEDAPDFRRLDLTDAAAVEEACQGADVVINTAHDPGLILEQTVLRRGGVLLDLIELTRNERRRLAEVTEPRGLVVIHTGLGGVAYLAIAELLRSAPGADGAEYALMLNATGSSGRAGGSFAHGLLTNFSHHSTATVPLPEPFGTRRCLEAGGHYTGIPRAAVGGTPVRHYLCLQPPALDLVMRGLNAARMIAALPKAAFTAGPKRVPEELSDEPICEWVAVSRSGSRLASRTIEGRGYYAMTVTATSVFAQRLAQGPDGRAGVKSIEEVLTLAEVAPALETAGIALREQTAGVAA